MSRLKNWGGGGGGVRHRVAENEPVAIKNSTWMIIQHRTGKISYSTLKEILGKEIGASVDEYRSTWMTALPN